MELPSSKRIRIRQSPSQKKPVFIWHKADQKKVMYNGYDFSLKTPDIVTYDANNPPPMDTNPGNTTSTAPTIEPAVAATAATAVPPPLPATTTVVTHHHHHRQPSTVATAAPPPQLQKRRYSSSPETAGWQSAAESEPIKKHVRLDIGPAKRRGTVYIAQIDEIQRLEHLVPQINAAELAIHPYLVPISKDTVARIVQAMHFALDNHQLVMLEDMCEFIKREKLPINSVGWLITRYMYYGNFNEDYGKFIVLQRQAIKLQDSIVARKTMETFLYHICVRNNAK